MNLLTNIRLDILVKFVFSSKIKYAVNTNKSNKLFQYVGGETNGGNLCGEQNLVSAQIQLRIPNEIHLAVYGDPAGIRYHDVGGGHQHFDRAFFDYLKFEQLNKNM